MYPTRRRESGGSSSKPVTSKVSHKKRPKIFHAMIRVARALTDCVNETSAQEAAQRDPQTKMSSSWSFPDGCEQIRSQKGPHTADRWVGRSTVPTLNRLRQVMSWFSNWKLYMRSATKSTPRYHPHDVASPQLHKSSIHTPSRSDLC